MSRSIQETLRMVPLFDRLSDADLERIAGEVEATHLAAGEELFAEGEVGDQAYVICGGEIEIVKQSSGQEIALAVRRPPDVIGEIALLQSSPRTASARARTDVDLLAIPKATLDALLDTSPTAARALFGVLFERWQSTQVLLRQSERMAQLGTLTAGLAHELNNPAAAVNRASSRLGETIARLVDLERRLAVDVEQSTRSEVDGLRARLGASSRQPERLAPRDRLRRESEIEELLEQAGLDEAWRLAPASIDVGVDASLTEIIETAGPFSSLVVDLVIAEREVAQLVYEIEMGTGRMSAIARAFKSYTYHDQAPIQEVDVSAGIDDTLIILGPKLGDIMVDRDIQADLPPIEARGGELNQVWTNLIANAADAISQTGRADGEITIRAFEEGDRVVVEIADNGSGIPTTIHDRIFDSFFTTKPPGSGTGLGLALSYRTVVDDHGGSIGFQSVPGNTVFRVELKRTLTDRPA